VCTDNKQEGSPRGQGNQIEEAEDQGYNPLVPGRVVYIYRYQELKYLHQVEFSDTSPQALLIYTIKQASPKKLHFSIPQSNQCLEGLHQVS